MTCSSLRLGWVPIVLSLTAVGGAPFAAGPTLGRVRAAVAPVDVGAVTSHLKRAEANLQLVNSSIGHLSAPPKGSAAKLARMRLEQAAGDLEPAGQLLAGLGDGSGVSEAKQRHATAVALYEKLAGILTGAPPQPAPEPTPAPTPRPSAKEATAAPPATVKLGYPHADNFKNALFTLRRVEGDAAGLAELVEQLRPTPDPLTIDHRRTASAVASVAETRRQAGFAREALGKIPANGEGVAEAHQRLADARASLDASAAYFQPLHAQLMEMIDPARFPDYRRDLDRITELASAYANLDYLFRDQRARAAELLQQQDAAREECLRIARVYLRLIEQRTEMGVRIDGAGNGFLSAHAAFLAEAEKQRLALPASIRKDLAESDRMANEAVANQKPLWFTGGIPQHMGWAEDKLALYEVLDPANGPALRRDVAAMQTSLRERADSLRELIIRENTLPPDRFTGPDRDRAVAVAVDAWKVQQPEFEVLAVRIPSEAWSRETKWTYSNGTWYFSDRSTLQVRLIVADESNEELAIDRAINVRKDHQKNDALIGVPLRSLDEELQPREYLLRSKVR